MATLTAKEFANKVMGYLKDAGGWRPSPSILRGLDIPDEHHNVGRSILKRMHRVGLLEKRGEGKYFWRNTVVTWNESDPFKTEGLTKAGNGNGTSKPLAHLTASADPTNDNQYMIHDETFSVKHILKNAGCEWDNDRKRWTCEPIFLNQLTNLGLRVTSEKPADAENESERNGHTTDTELLERIAKLESELATINATRKIEITLKQPNKPNVKIEERLHPIFEQVLFHINCGDNVMLVGPKGCGKTVLAEQIAKVLGVDFGMISLSGGVTESKLFGRVTPNITNGKSVFTPAQFSDMFEHSGCFLLDEVDAADPNVLLSINSALANGVLALDREKNPIAKKHKEFYAIAAANTWGNGADRQYVGRNQQDSAFTERFVQVAMDYDSGLELALCPGAEDMVRTLHAYRAKMSEARVERTLSTRFIVRAFNWLQHGKVMAYVEEMLFAGWRADEVRKVKG